MKQKYRKKYFMIHAEIRIVLFILLQTLHFCSIFQQPFCLVLTSSCIKISQLPHSKYWLYIPWQIFHLFTISCSRDFLLMFFGVYLSFQARLLGLILSSVSVIGARVLDCLVHQEWIKRNNFAKNYPKRTWDMIENVFNHIKVQFILIFILLISHMWIDLS